MRAPDVEWTLRRAQLRSSAAARWGGRLFAAGLVLCAAGQAGAEPDWRYVDSRGEMRELTLAQDCIYVQLEPGARIAGRPELSALAAGAGAWRVLPLAAGWRGRAEQAAERLLRDGLARRTGAVIALPDGQRLRLPPRILVRLRAGSEPPAPAWLCSERIDALDAGERLYLARFRTAALALAAAREAAGLAGVDWAVPDFELPVELLGAPSDPYYTRQWTLQRDGSEAHLHCEEAWEITRGDERVVLAVIDTGVALEHPDFDPGRMLPGYDSAAGDDDPSPADSALDAHGTAVAGVAAATADNAEGISGVCPGCSLLPIKMMEAGDFAALSRGYLALDHAASRAWVLSNSWAIDEAFTGVVDMAAFQLAIRKAVTQGRDGLGAVVLFASGNGDGQHQAQPIGEHELQNLPEILAVGGSDAADRVQPYSDYGPNLSVIAPTGDLDPGTWGVFTTDTPGERGFSRDGLFYLPGPGGGDESTGRVEPDASGDYTAYLNGTSMACPAAAGVVGLVLSANPALRGAEARAVLEGTADQVGDVDYGDLGWHERYGHGRVNAARAVRAARLGVGLGDGAVCAEDVNCESGACFKAGPGEPTGLCAEACAQDADCEPGFVCRPLAAEVESVCLRSCKSHADCMPGTVCDGDGACRRIACDGDRDCPEGTVCLGEECFPDEDVGDPVGGCVCGAGGSGAELFLLWLLFALACRAVLRRREPRRAP
ncbi:MAG: S8 family serine peptidase [Deltaproteobacteria bacterium]|nr:S8 family serine peptidase [Deltaproteobacteria bacterium]